MIDTESNEKEDQGDHTYTAIIWFPPGIHIPSTNYLYRPGIKRGRFPYLYKEERVEVFQKHFIELGEKTELILMRKIPYFSLDLSLTFLIRDRFWRRDVSNMIKSSEDSLVHIIGIDDSRVLHLTAKKELQTTKREGIKVIVYGTCIN